MPDKYGIQTWEQMVTQVVVHGRPDHIRSAAAGWEIALRNLSSVKTSLDDNVDDLGATWTGAAYESFREHIGRISENLQSVSDDANTSGTIVGTLNESADRLAAAQGEIPIPATLEDEVAAARNQDQGIADGIFESAAVGMLGLPFGPIGVALGTALGAALSSAGVFDQLSDWLNDRTDEARVIWNRLNSEIEGEAAATPSSVQVGRNETNPLNDIPTLGTLAPSTDIGALTGGSGVAGATPSLTAEPSAVGSVAPPGTGASDPSTSGAAPPGTAAGAPSLGSGAAGFDPDVATPGTASFDPDSLGAGSPGTGSLGAETPGGTGLAGAGGLGSPSAGGLGAGGLGGLGTGTGSLGAGGLGSPGGLGASAGGPGGAPLGGGALGKPVSPAQAGIPGVGALGAGAGAGRGAGKGGAGASGKPSLSSGVAGGRPGAAGLAGVGGAGAGAGFGNEEEHTTWLTEDDDVWGGSGSAAPGVLR